MAPMTIGLLALSMSVDAFAASIGRGAASARQGLIAIVATGALFGLIEAMTPLIGWTMGMVASRYVQAFDHWIAFSLLALVGTRMVINAFGPQKAEAATANTRLALVATAIGTSLDAMAVGASLALLDVNILIIAAAIGAATMAMTMIGLCIGGLLGRRFGRSIEILGGLVLVGIGSTILFEHLTA